MNPITLTKEMVEQSLNQVITAAYLEKRPALESVNLIPLGASIDPSAKTIEFDVITEIGMAKMIEDYSKDLPPVSIQKRENFVPVKVFGVSYSYSYMDILRARRLGMNLSTTKASTARFSIENAFNKYALVGNESAGITGFFNNVNVPVTTASFDADTATADEIAGFIQGLFDNMEQATNGTEEANAIVFPTTLYNKLNSRRIGDNSDTRIIQYLQDTFPQITFWGRSKELNDAGIDGVPRVILYTKDATAVSRRNALNFTQLPEQWAGIAATVNCLASTAGTVFERPLSAIYADIGEGGEESGEESGEEGA